MGSSWSNLLPNFYRNRQGSSMRMTPANCCNQCLQLKSVPLHCHGPQFEYGTPKLPESRGVTFQTRIHWSNVKFCWVFAFRVTGKELIIPSSKHSPTSQTPKFPLHIIITSSCPNLKMQWKFRGSGIICSSASVYQHVIC